MAYPDYGTFPKYGGGGSFPESTPVSATTDTGYLAYSRAGRLFLPASVNYCTNPSFETDTNSDGTTDGLLTALTGVAGSYTFTTPAGRTGGKAQRIQYTGTAGDSSATSRVYVLTDVGSFAAGDIVTLSGYFKSASNDGAGAATLNLVPCDSAGNGLAGTVSATVAQTITDWTRFSVTSAALPATTSRIRISVNNGAIVEGDTIDITIDDVLIEKSSILTPYFDGSSPERGCSWSGAANASTSVRAASRLQVGFPASSSQGISIAARFSPLFPATDGAAHQFFAGGTAASGWFSTAKSAGSAIQAFYNDGVGTANFSSAAQNFSANTSHRVVTRFHANATMDINHDGTNATQAALPLTSAAWSTISINLNDSQPASSYVSPLAVCPTRITDAETTQLSSVLASCSGAELYKWFYDRGYYGTLILPLQSDSTGYIVGGGSTPRDNYTYTPTTATTDTGYEVYA